MLILALMVSVTAFSQAKITVKGSDTMVILAQRWAELYMKNNPQTVIQVTAGIADESILDLVARIVTVVLEKDAAPLASLRGGIGGSKDDRL